MTRGLETQKVLGRSMKKYSKITLMIFMSLFPSMIYAAQNGYVLSDETKIRTRPSKVSPELLSVHRGQVLRISSQARKNWYKVLLPQPQKKRKFGWIHVNDVTLEDFRRDLESAGIQQSEATFSEKYKMKRWNVSLYYGFVFSQPKKFQEFLGAQKETLQIGIPKFELGYRIDSDWVLSLYGGPYEFENDYTTSSQKFSYRSEGFFLLISSKGPIFLSNPFDVALNIGVGATLGGKIENRNASGVVLASGEVVAPVVLARLSTLFYLNQKFSLGLYPGYQVSFQSGVEFDGSNVDFSFSGPLLELGLSFYF